MLDFIVRNDVTEAEIEESSQKADKRRETKDTAAVIKQYADIIRTKKKSIISIAYHQGKVFKRFKDKERFIKLVKMFKVRKSAIIFKTDIFKLIDMHSKLMKSSRTLGFLKTITGILRKFVTKFETSLKR